MMYKRIISVTFLSVSCFFTHVRGDVTVRVAAPSIVFRTAPPRVLVEKNIYVVPDFDHEVFIVSGVYWTCWKGNWYRLPKYNGRWVKVNKGKVPPGLVKLPRGRYIRYRKAVHVRKKNKQRAQHRKKTRNGRKGRGRGTKKR